MKNQQQLIWIMDHYEVADDSNSELPCWPVQDQYARWHNKQFAGQRVAYRNDSVDFGFLAIQLTPDEDAAIDRVNWPDGLYTVPGVGLFKEIN